MDAATWSGFIDELATMVDVLHRLRATHVDDGHGFCAACTRPGRGTPYVRFPCPMRTLVQLAEERHR